METMIDRTADAFMQPPFFFPRRAKGHGCTRIRSPGSRSPSWPRLPDPCGQWHACGPRHDYSRGAAWASHPLPLVRGEPIADSVPVKEPRSVYHPLPVSMGPCAGPLSLTVAVSSLHTASRTTTSPGLVIETRGCRFPPIRPSHAPKSSRGVAKIAEQVFRLPDQPPAAPSRLSGQWLKGCVRPRLRRRVRDGFSPSSLCMPEGQLRTDTLYPRTGTGQPPPSFLNACGSFSGGRGRGRWGC